MHSISSNAGRSADLETEAQRSLQGPAGQEIPPCVQSSASRSCSRNSFLFRFHCPVPSVGQGMSRSDEGLRKRIWGLGAQCSQETQGPRPFPP